VTENDPFTREIIGAAIEVHREMGPGLLESVYQRCLEEELRLRGIPFQAQLQLPLKYKGLILDTELIMDVYFPGKLVVELKAVEKLMPIHEAQLLTHMKLSNTKFGLLMNFNTTVLKDGVKRMVL
jgi:GxxExxY protein